VPTLVVPGGADQVTPPELGSGLADLVPRTQLEVLPGAGHLASLERPDTFTDLVRRHLAHARPPLVCRAEGRAARDD
jgi:pimeloyl-ACP methyl ester carboxylesterase